MKDRKNANPFDKTTAAQSQAVETSAQAGQEQSQGNLDQDKANDASQETSSKIGEVNEFLNQETVTETNSESSAEQQSEPDIKADPVVESAVVTEPAVASEVKVDEENPVQETPSYDGMTETGKLLLAEIEEYEVAMAKGKVLSTDVQSRYQVRFYQAIQRIFNLDEGFDLVYRALLAKIKANATGAFSETHIARCREIIPLSAVDRRAFTKMINLLLATCDIQSWPASLQQIDFELTMQYGFTPQGQQNVLNFYRR